MTDQMKADALAEFSATLNSLKMSDGHLCYKQNYFYEKCRATVWLSPEAYRKTVALVNEFADEVAWHGTVSRSGDSEFVINDIFVYPQEVTTGTVTTDQSAYTEWLYSLDDDTFNAVRMQGHSHVNMSVSPSGVDDNHRKQILEQLESDMFYIFMVWNKSLNIHTLIYDMSQNILYENKDIDVKLLMGEGMEDFLTDVRAKVQKHSAVKKPKKPRKQKKSEPIQFDENMIEFGESDYPYPFAACDVNDPFFVQGESLWQH
jgi:hypothetical protein